MSRQPCRRMATNNLIGAGFVVDNSAHVDLELGLLSVGAGDEHQRAINHEMGSCRVAMDERVPTTDVY